MSDDKRWLVQQDDDRIYFCIRQAGSGNVNVVGKFTGGRENADYMVELMNEAHEIREAARQTGA